MDDVSYKTQPRWRRINCARKRSARAMHTLVLTLAMMLALFVLTSSVLFGVLLFYEHVPLPKTRPLKPGESTLPNLVPVISKPKLDEKKFSSSHCAVREGCTEAGERRLLRFDLAVENRGLTSVAYGAPAKHDELFVFSPCHGHYHFGNFSDYTLLGSDGVVRRGHKQAYCLRDTRENEFQDFAAVVPKRRFTCDDQGISAGWADVYGGQLDCQWIDVTGLKSGRYTLRVQINNNVIEESNYEDNTAELEVEI